MKSRLGRGALLVAAIGAYVVLSDLALDRYRERVPRVFRSRSNELFARRSSYQVALDRFHWRWSPGYPTVLWVARHAGLRPDRVNLALLWLSVAGMALVARRHLRGAGVAWPTVLFAAGSYHFYNLRQLSSEALVLPLAFLAYDRLAAYADRPGGLRAAIVGVVALALALTRLFTLAWIAPIAGALFARAAGGRRLLHGAVFVAILMPPVVGLLVHVRAETGHWTGMDRRNWGARTLDPGLAHWTEDTGPAAQLVRAAKVLAIDHLSHDRHASHEVISPAPGGERVSVAPGRRRSHAAIDEPWRPNAIDLAAGAIALLAAGALGVAWARGHPRPRLRTPGLLAVAFLGVFLLLTVGLWPVSNSDPLYSRFLYPAYPWLILALFFAYAALREAGGPPRVGLALRALYGAALVVQVVKVVGFSLSAGGSG